MRCQAIQLQLHLELLEAKTISAPGKSVTAYFMKTFANTQLFTPPEAVLWRWVRAACALPNLPRHSKPLSAAAHRGNSSRSPWNQVGLGFLLSVCRVNKSQKCAIPLQCGIKRSHLATKAFLVLSTDALLFTFKVCILSVLPTRPLPSPPGCLSCL